MSQVGKDLRGARLRAGLTQRELARIVGISSFCLNRVEAGTTAFRDEWIDRLPTAVRVPVIEALVGHHASEARRLRLLVFQRRRPSSGPA